MDGGLQTSLTSANISLPSCNIENRNHLLFKKKKHESINK